MCEDMYDRSDWEDDPNEFDQEFEDEMKEKEELEKELTQAKGISAFWFLNWLFGG